MDVEDISRGCMWEEQGYIKMKLSTASLPIYPHLGRVITHFRGICRGNGGFCRHTFPCRILYRCEEGPMLFRVPFVCVWKARGEWKGIPRIVERAKVCYVLLSKV